MPTVLFIQPTQYGPDGKLCKQSRIHLPGLVFPLLAALTPSHWDIRVRVEVVDDIDPDAEVARGVDLVAIGAMGYAIFRGAELGDAFRARGVKVVFGGIMASMVPEKVLEHCDSVVIGDAETAWPHLLRDLEATGEIARIYDEPVQSLAGLPPPRYDLLTEKPLGNMLPVQAGRGCPHLCSFCSIACVYRGRYMARPVDEVLRDIQQVKRLGFRRFYLLDDNIVANPRFLEELCERIAPLKMTWASQCSLNLARNPALLKKVADSGCDLLSLGLESISQEGLDGMGKPWVKAAEHEALLQRLRDAGIMPSSEMIVGLDSDTPESIRETLAFVERAAIAIPRFYILTPIPGSELYEQLKAEGRLTTEAWERFDGSQAVHRPAHLTPEQLTELYWWLNEQIFSMRSILKRTLLNPAARRQPGLHLFAFGANLHYRRYVKKRVPPNIF
ncbi:MAG: radical SAM protein [Pseudomonadota bacterium]